MHALRRLIPLAALIAAGCSTNSPTAPKPVLQPLFNDRNLDGWVIMHGGTWTVADGVLTGRNGVDWSTNPEKSGSWLRTVKEYGDFLLEFEYAINEKGNSGVFLRSGLEKNPAFTGNEMQILDDSQMTKPEKWSTGALYDVVAASKVMSKPAGEWNKVRIEARGPTLSIWMNDELILDHATTRSLRGYVGLQNHDDKSVVRFRNLRLAEI